MFTSRTLYSAAFRFAVVICYSLPHHLWHLRHRRPALRRLLALFLIWSLFVPFLLLGSGRKTFAAQSGVTPVTALPPISSAPPAPYQMAATSAFALPATVAGAWTETKLTKFNRRAADFGWLTATGMTFTAATAESLTFFAAYLTTFGFFKSSTASAPNTAAILTPPPPAPLPNPATVSFDFTGDGKADLVRWQPNTTLWSQQDYASGTVTTQTFGVAGAVSAPADFDGDGKTDLATFNAATGYWSIKKSITGTATSATWGQSGDLPAAADYDGDGKADVAVYRPSNSTFYVVRSSDGGISTQQLGQSGDIPAGGDFDGDTKADFAVFRPATGQWFVIPSSTGNLTGLNWGSRAMSRSPPTMTATAKAIMPFIARRAAPGMRSNQSTTTQLISVKSGAITATSRSRRITTVTAKPISPSGDRRPESGLFCRVSPRCRSGKPSG